MQQGNCCSDYNKCERLTTDNRGKEELCKQIPHCELCDYNSSSLTCAQCNKNYFLSNGTCASQCDKNQIVMIDNRFCKNNIGN